MPVAVTAVAGWLGSLGVGAATAGWLASAVVNLGVSTLLRTALGAKQRKPGAPAVTRELAEPTERPVYRFVYGQTATPGTWAPLRVKGEVIYGCLILNSRPSSAVTGLTLDGREVVLQGDRYDFAGSGASASNGLMAGHFTCWVGLGDQVGPPARILEEAGDIFAATDGWRGLTVMWVRIKAGDNDERQERWPAAPPQFLVRGNWSRVWDPRNPAQQPDKPATWSWSANQALIVLDALRQNPIRRYRLSNLDLPSFLVAASIADRVVPTRRGTEALYRADGTLIFDGRELLDQLSPLFEAGASRPVRSGGRLGIVPGAVIEQTSTITDLLDSEGVEFVRWQPAREMKNVWRTTYVSPQRAYEAADLQPFALPGAVAADGEESVEEMNLTFVQRPSQACRLRLIAARSARMQRQLSGTLPPDQLMLVAGSRVQVTLPAPWGAMSGTYQVETIAPGMAPLGEDGATAMRLPVALREWSPSIYDYNPDVDEEIVEDPAADPSLGGIAPPRNVAVIGGAAAALDDGDRVVPRIQLTWSASPTARVSHYRWFWRLSSATAWIDGGTVAARAPGVGGTYQAFLVPVAVGTRYDLAVVACDLTGGSSDRTAAQVLQVQALGPAVEIAPPGAPSPTETGGGTVRITLTAPNDPAVRGVELLASAGGDPAGASRVGQVLACGPNATLSWTESGLPTGNRSYWARARGAYGALSDLSARASLFVS